MGIQDRDYMRERGRRADAASQERRDLPFAPPRAGPSVLVMVLTWVSAAFLLYRGYEWLHARQQQARSPVTNVAVANTRQDEVQPAQPSPSRRFAATETGNANARVRIETALAPVRPEPAQERPREAAAPQTGGTLYLCKAYSGGTFWAQAHCGQHRALIDSIVPVPAGLPFEQQVQLAEQRRQATSTVYNAPVQVRGEVADLGKAECKALDARVEQLDAMARAPQSAQMQDWIRAQRQEARDRQFALHC